MRSTIRVAALVVSMSVLWPPSAEGHENNEGRVGDKEECVVRWTETTGDTLSLTTANRQACLNQARLAGEQPSLTVNSIRRGPGGEQAISSSQPQHCEFIPYKMHLKGRGRSRKFWCYRTDARGRYYSDRWVLVPEAVKVSAGGYLVDAGGHMLTNELGRVQRPEILKVKYTTGGNRGREVYTEVAVARFLWTLGFPADHMFRTRVSCRGCSKDPFRDIRTRADNYPRRETNVFHEASIERKAWALLDADDDDGWDWEEVYADWSLEPRKRIEFEAYVLALNMVHFHHGISKQNSLACDLDTWDSTTGTCREPVIFLDDPGSSFGGGKARGKYSKYRENGVFLEGGSGSCRLRADLAGFGRPSEPARRFLVERLQELTPDGVRAIFEAAGFNRETTGGSVDEWTHTFLDRFREVRDAVCS